MKIHKYLTFGLMTALMGAMVSCSENEAPEMNVTPEGEEVEITVKFITENGTGTRAVDDNFTPTVSKGSQVDVLVYGVYDEKGNLLDYYQVNNGQGTGCPSTFTPGTGQNAVGFTAGEVKTLVLKVNKDRNYKIACWAQSSACKAYNTSDLTAVTVSYADAQNNDELRDAFCGASQVFSGGTTEDITITLKRPFAQINVGTTGADFKVSARIPGGTHYTYSRISLKGVANTLNVYTGQVGAVTTDATFSLNKIPAYWNMAVPTDASSLNYGKAGEEFLLVDLDGDKAYKPFKTDYSTVRRDVKGNIYKFKTETFKYMSMCYVLVPGSLEYATKAEEGATGASIQEVTVMFAGDEKGAETTGVNTAFTLTNVPAMGNYRTNILGGLYDTYPTGYDPENPDGPGPGNIEDPDDPEDPNYPGDPDNPTDPDDPNNPDNPDDPTTLFNSASIKVLINVQYLGDKEAQVIGR